jgi:catechol 2,3-dioxygenase-like lactoylglutathione lyase family enzyme
MSTDITGIAVVSLPVSDLARSAVFYRDLLGLDYAREFADEHGAVTGCALADFGAGYMIALRRRDTVAGRADLRGEHPIIAVVPDRAALGRLHDRFAAEGFAPVAGEHADAAWLEVVDPDGIAIRFAVLHAEARFLGVEPGGFYDVPRLLLTAGV